MIDARPFVENLQGKPVAICGLGLSGASTAKALKAAGAEVFGWDDSAEKRAVAKNDGVEILDLTKEELSRFACLVLAPGIPLYFPEPHPAVVRAREAGIEIIGDLEILHRCGHGRRTIGITGTNGKSTTTALVTHILKSAGIDCVMGGNIGTPVLDMDLPGSEGFIVLEISSYQVDLCPTFRPDIAALLNITPDHLDRHGTIEGYAAAKERIFEGEGVAICGIDDAPSLAIYDRVQAAGTRKAIPVSVKKETSGIYAKDGRLFDSTHELYSLAEFTTLPGLHNHQNIAVAYAICREAGLDSGQIQRGIKSYPGLAHRQFVTRVINGVAYINDSKATNADAMTKALACYSNIYLIAGGRAKEGGLKGIEPFLDKIRHVFLIGESADDFAKYLTQIGLPHTKSHMLNVAVLEAHVMAQADRGQPGGAAHVLLSPACASWDQFRSFEHRGDVFTELVNALPDEAAT